MVVRPAIVSHSPGRPKHTPEETPCLAAVLTVLYVSFAIYGLTCSVRQVPLMPS